MNPLPPRFHKTLARLAFLAALFSTAAAAANRYLLHTLVSDLPAIADQTDGSLMNPWDFYFPNQLLMIADGGSGSLSQYTAVPAIVQQPVPAFLGKNITGIMGLFSGPLVNSKTVTLFCTQNGTIVALTMYATPVPSVQVLIDNSKSGAVYTGCTSNFQGNMYYAANFASRRIDIWDSNLDPVQSPASFTDPDIPLGFAPFNIQNMATYFLVTYARRDTSSNNDVPGLGNGYIARFDTTGKLLNTLVAGGPLNSPWGLAIGNASFGDFANLMLVGNSGDGQINAFDPLTGAWKGTLADPQANPIAIPGLHALHFGTGFRVPYNANFGGGDPDTLYVTAGIAGPYGEPIGSHGLLASIQPSPSFQPDGILNGADFSSNIAPDTWATIQGGALAATTRSWAITDFAGQSLPTALDGVTVTVNGESVYVSYISPDQINFLIPPDLAPGPAEFVVTNNGLASAPVQATLANAAPAFFLFFPDSPPDEQFIAGLHANNSPATTVLPGETVSLFGTGFGPTTPEAPNGQLFTTPLPLAQPLQVTIGGVPSTVTFAGLVSPGVFQLNVSVPPVANTYYFFPVPVALSITGAPAASGLLGYDWQAIPRN